jgi:hypothetical protein
LPLFHEGRGLKLFTEVASVDLSASFLQGVNETNSNEKAKAFTKKVCVVMQNDF